MGVAFIVCCLACALTLFIPGVLVGKALLLRNDLALASAPLFSVGLFVILTLVYGFFKVPCSLGTVFVPAMLIGLAVLVVSLVVVKRNESFVKCTKRDWLLLLLYVFAGGTMCYYVFVSCLDGFDSFMISFDSITHFTLIRNFLEGYAWSPLLASIEDLSESASAMASRSFYPVAWHQVVALGAQIAQCDVAIAVNACNAVIAGLVFPCSMYCLSRALFQGKSSFIAAGSLMCMSFAVLPWFMIYKGIIYANYFGNALLPSFIALFIVITKEQIALMGRAVQMVVLLILGLFSLAVSHTSTIFAAYVFLTPYVGHLIPRIAGGGVGRDVSFPKRKTYPILVAYTILVVLVWVAMVKAPALSSTVCYTNSSKVDHSLTSAVFSVISLSFTNGLPQWALAVFCFIGFCILFYRRQYWMMLPTLFMIVAFVACRTLDGSPKWFLAGFWYNDPWRISYLLAIYLVPVATVGLSTVLSCARSLTNSLFSQQRRVSIAARRAERIVVVGITAIFCCYNFFPAFHLSIGQKETVDTPFGIVRSAIKTASNMEKEKAFSVEEREFVREALQCLPDDALVINMPHDGSVFAFGLEGMRIYTRSTSIDNESEARSVIRKGLADIASNKGVEKAVEDEGADYVLLLDQGIVPEASENWMPRFSEEGERAWAGITSITDDTPGFEVVLARGDMRLYRITDA